MRPKLLPALSVGGAPAAYDRHRHEPHRFPLHRWVLARMIERGILPKDTELLYNVHENH